MAKKKKDLNINIDTKKVDVKLTRKDGKTNLEIDTDKVDINYEKHGDEAIFTVDTEKADVTIKKDKHNTTIEVSDQSGILGKVVSFIKRLF
jgi:septum formation topological specificity factor MinE